MSHSPSTSLDLLQTECSRIHAELLGVRESPRRNELIERLNGLGDILNTMAMPHFLANHLPPPDQLDPQSKRVLEFWVESESAFHRDLLKQVKLLRRWSEELSDSSLRTTFRLSRLKKFLTVQENREKLLQIESADLEELRRCNAKHIKINNKGQPLTGLQVPLQLWVQISKQITSILNLKTFMQNQNEKLEWQHRWLGFKKRQVQTLSQRGRAR